jgi:acetate---CoA ligase (ADP-forming)
MDATHKSDQSPPALYPAHHQRHVVLITGATVLLRPVRPTDQEALASLHAALSADSAYARFLGLRPNLKQLTERLVDVDYRDTYTLVAESGSRIVGTATYFREMPASGRAEVAFAVSDAWQGLGLGTLLLERLAQVAPEAGIDSFDASTRSDNSAMLNVFRDCGFTVTSSQDGGVVQVSLHLGPTDEYTERHAVRAATAAHRSIKPFFEPRSVAVIGASRTRSKIGGQMFWNLKSGGFRGALYPVNPGVEEIEGVRAFAKVADIPGSVDLAVITVPAAFVDAVVEECIQKGIKALVVISAGFAEVGAEGRAAQEALVDRVRRAGVRLVGPNCMGLLNTDPAVQLNSTFASHLPPRGRVAMSTQSGALGLAVLDYAQRLDLGISSFVSVGNKADVSGNDLIQYWSEDRNTDVILLYLESFGNPRRFAEIARRTSRRKPIVAVKAGRSQAGLRAAQSHTGALATDDAVVEALFEQCGVIRTRTLEEMFDVASLLAHQPLPGGARVAILTNAGGAAILAADACEAEGLDVTPVGDAAVRSLREFLPAAASTSNPIDMIASASPEQYRRSIPILLADPAVDSLIVVYVPPVVSDPGAIARAIADGVRDAASAKPVLVTFTSAAGAPEALAGLPTCAFPERAATALARVTTYATWRREAPVRLQAGTPFDRRAVRRQLQEAIASGVEWLDPQTADSVLRAAEIPAVQAAFSPTVEDAVRAAGTIGFPVALKAAGAKIVHKTEVQGVRLGLADGNAVRDACRTMQDRLGSRLAGFFVQAMAPEAPEFLVGCVTDPLFGPVIACGAGGTLAELLEDMSFRLPPVTERDADEMLESLRSAKLLRGFRGEPARDEAALKHVVMRLSALVDACPEIVEMDLNPVRVYQEGALVLDARIRVAPLNRRPPSGRVDY